MNERIAEVKTMQLATTSAGNPWVCSVYFVLHDGCLYWLSEPNRRHSQELAVNPRVAVAIVIKQNVPVTGVQIEGLAEEVENVAEAETVLPLYVSKYGQGGRFVERLKLGQNKHTLYRLTPEKAMAFDEDAHPDAPYWEIVL